MTDPLRVAFAGTPEFAVAPLRAILASRHSVVGVLTQPDRPAGRGRQVTDGPVKTAALLAQLPVAQPPRLRTHEDCAALSSWHADVLVVVAYGLILPPTVLAIPRLGCVNIHASLLPRWRGAAPIQRAIMAGDAVTGITIMQMDANLDTGPILLTKELSIDRQMDTVELQAALSLLGSDMIVRALDGLAVGSLTPHAQPVTGATYASKIQRSEAAVDFSRDAQDLERQVRGLTPWPVAETLLHGQQLRIHAALALSDQQVDGASAARRSGLPPGTVLGPVTLPPVLGFAGSAGVAVLCGSGVLALLRLQRAGRKLLDADDFLRGDSLTGILLGNKE